MLEMLKLRLWTPNALQLWTLLVQNQVEWDPLARAMDTQAQDSRFVAVLMQVGQGCQDAGAVHQTPAVQTGVAQGSRAPVAPAQDSQDTQKKESRQPFPPKTETLAAPALMPRLTAVSGG